MKGTTVMKPAKAMLRQLVVETSTMGEMEVEMKSGGMITMTEETGNLGM